MNASVMVMTRSCVAAVGCALFKNGLFEICGKNPCGRKAAWAQAATASNSCVSLDFLWGLRGFVEIGDNFLRDAFLFIQNGVFMSSFQMGLLPLWRSKNTEDWLIFFFFCFFCEHFVEINGRNSVFFTDAIFAVPYGQVETLYIEFFGALEVNSLIPTGCLFFKWKHTAACEVCQHLRQNKMHICCVIHWCIVQVLMKIWRRPPKR